jgi:heme-degrading monooxygenase HmoA
MPRFVYVWTFRVKEGAVPEFVRRYGAEGDWVRLFRSATGYVDTQLLASREDPRVFATIDRWESAEAHAAFRAENREALEALDRACAELTEDETKLGNFEETP